MQKKRIAVILLVASMMTTTQLLLPVEAKEDARELTTINTRDKVIKILNNINTYKDELERIKLEEEVARLEEQRILEEEKRLEEERLEEQNRLENERLQKERESKRVPVTFELSAYCSCSQCSEGWGTHTASGLPVREGFVALPDDIPFGTRVIIPSLEYEYVCQDRGGFIDYTNEGYMRVDVYMNSHEECLQFGRFVVEGYLEYE
ncbi:3D domain-containing protein [uncultured Clostridium sp.]|uniref:3D domain-containing protein n=1 Tax=uncultured Clostridium sp. TaxID=59620 RepID=UPI003217DFD3